MIPPIIHQIWLNFKEPGVDQELPIKYAELQKGWRKLNPNCKHMLWNDSKALALMREYFPRWLPMWHAYKSPIYRCDALRIFILIHYGGVYVDCDCKALKSIEPLLQSQDTIVVLSKGCFTNWFLAAKSQHTLMYKILAEMETRQKSCLFHRDNSAAGPMWCTGPWMTDKIIGGYIKNNSHIENTMRIGMENEYFRHSSHGTWYNGTSLFNDILLLVTIIIFIVLFFFLGYRW